MSAEVGLALVVAGGIAVSVAFAFVTLLGGGPIPDAPRRNCDPESGATRHHCVACRPQLALAYVPER